MIVIARLILAERQECVAGARLKAERNKVLEGPLRLGEAVQVVQNAAQRPPPMAPGRFQMQALLIKADRLNQVVGLLRLFGLHRNLLKAGKRCREYGNRNQQDCQGKQPGGHKQNYTRGDPGTATPLKLQNEYFAPTSSTLCPKP